ncbi:MAG: hypothetical protein WD377_07320 [Nitriliruptoraceae bacterium]
MHRWMSLLRMGGALALFALAPMSATASSCAPDGEQHFVAQLHGDGDVASGHRVDVDTPDCTTTDHTAAPVGVAILHRTDQGLVEHAGLGSEAGDVRTQVRVRDRTAVRRDLVVDGPLGRTETEDVIGVPQVVMIEIDYPRGWTVTQPVARGVTTEFNDGRTRVMTAAVMFTPITADEFVLTVDATPGRGTPTVRVRTSPVSHVDRTGIPGELLSAPEAAVLGGLAQLVHEGTLELVDGTQELSDSTTEFADGVAELADGARELADGMTEYADGVAELDDGTTDITDGAAELVEGTDEFADGIDDLADGLRQLADGANDAASGAAGVSKGVSSIESAYAAVAGDPASLADIAAAPAPIQTLYGTLDAIFTGSDQLDDGADALADGLDELADGLDDVATTAEGTLRDGSAELADGTREFADGLNDLAEAITELADAANDLAGGTAELSDGSADVADGASELAGGTAELADGVREMPDAVAEIRGVADRAGHKRAELRARIHDGVERAATVPITSAVLTAPGQTPADPFVVGALAATTVLLAGLGIGRHGVRRRLLRWLTHREAAT